MDTGNPALSLQCVPELGAVTLLPVHPPVNCCERFACVDCSETTNRVQHQLRGQSQCLADSSGLYSFLTDSEGNRGTYREKIKRG